MKTVFSILILLFVFSLNGICQVNPNSTYVNGYTKSNGTNVQGYYRTTPNKTINDNYSTSPNVNPYTGKQGTVSPTYKAPTYSTPTYKAPTYSTPTYKAPTYSTPTYKKPTYY
jgi:hypothetical protein